MTADAVVGHDGFLLGTEATYDVKDGKLSKYNLAAGFNAPEYAVTLHALGNLSLYSASYYHRVNADIETSARATYNTKGPATQTNLEVGTKTCVMGTDPGGGYCREGTPLTLPYADMLLPTSAATSTTPPLSRPRSTTRASSALATRRRSGEFRPSLGAMYCILSTRSLRIC